MPSSYTIAIQPAPIQRRELIPDEPPRTMLTQMPDPALASWNRQAHPGYGLKAQTLLSSYRQAELGYTWQQCDVFDDVIESDGHLRAQLEARIDAVAGKPWIVLPGGDLRADQTAAEELEGALRDVPAFSDVLAHQLKANWYGYSASEIEWQYTNGIIAPVSFANAPHRRMLFDYATYAPRYMTGLSMEGWPLEPGGWWMSTRSMSSYIPARAGLMRTAAWFGFFKRTTLRDLMVFSQRFGLPYVTGEYEAGASPEDKATLKEAVAKLGSDGAAVFSALCKINIHTVDGGKGSDVHGSIVSLANSEISKLVTGSTLTTETGGPGSLALGQVHADVAFELRAGDAEKLSQKFEQAIGAPFVKWNQMGKKTRPPRLKINLVRDMAPLTRAQILSILGSNLLLPLSGEQLRQDFQLKKPAAGDEITGPKPVAIGTAP
jgi:phage gp29-like protein